MTLQTTSHGSIVKNSYFFKANRRSLDEWRGMNTSWAIRKVPLMWFLHFYSSRHAIITLAWCFQYTYKYLIIYYMICYVIATQSYTWNGLKVILIISTLSFWTTNNDVGAKTTMISHCWVVLFVVCRNMKRNFLSFIRTRRTIIKM